MNVVQGNPGVVTCMENTKHNLETGDIVSFKEVVGMTTINGTTHKIKGKHLINNGITTTRQDRGFPFICTVVSPTKFSIGDMSDEAYQVYQHGGIARQIKLPKTVNFESLEKQLASPHYLTADFAKMEVPLHIHIAMLALDQFITDNAALPRPRWLNWWQHNHDFLLTFIHV